jgi:hypothetical protein
MADHSAKAPDAWSRKTRIVSRFHKLRFFVDLKIPVASIQKKISVPYTRHCRNGRCYMICMEAGPAEVLQLWRYHANQPYSAFDCSNVS